MSMVHMLQKSYKFQFLEVRRKDREWQRDKVLVLNEYLIFLVGRSVADRVWEALTYAKHNFTTFPKNKIAVVLH